MSNDKEFPRQQQDVPGSTSEMRPEPHDEMRGYPGGHLLAGKRALVTGGDSGIGRAVAIAFAKQAADVAIAYLEEEDDAGHTAALIEKEGQRSARFGRSSAGPWWTARQRRWADLTS